MSFSWSGSLRFTRNGLFRWRGTHYCLTPRRIGWPVGFYTLCPLLESITWGGLMLDELLLCGYREHTVRGPVVIIGNPCSGTTFLHRLLSRDAGNSAAMRTWEILSAPSVVQR